MSHRHMSTAADIKAAAGPPQALLAIGVALDSIIERLDRVEEKLNAAPSSSDWGIEWPAKDEDALTPVQERKLSELGVDVARQQRISAVTLQLEAATDPEERDALLAQLRLLQDTAANVIGPAVPEGQRVDIISDGSNGTVDIPPASPERQADRREWAGAIKLHEFIPLGAADAQDAFAKGGPMWLYLGNREAIMSMPTPWRQWLIADIHQDSPRQAQEVARDILKQAASADRSIAEHISETAGQ